MVHHSRTRYAYFLALSFFQTLSTPVMFSRVVATGIKKELPADIR
jgi:hypothetical protein